MTHQLRQRFGTCAFWQLQQAHRCQIHLASVVWQGGGAPGAVPQAGAVPQGGAVPQVPPQ